MRRQYFYWTYLVVSILFTAYGAYLLFYNLNHGKGLSVLHLVFMILGVVMLVAYLVMYARTVLKQKKLARQAEPIAQENKAEEKPAPALAEGKKEETAPALEAEKEPAPAHALEEEEEPEPVRYEAPSRRTTSYERHSEPRPRFRGGDAYIRKVGYGPVLRVNGARILDMRNNTYYRIQDNFVYCEGSGPAYEINGRRIRDVYGSYLYEISGGNINKVFGGFYASISGGTITVHDLSEKYEISDSLCVEQLLVVAALLFGRY